MDRKLCIKADIGQKQMSHKKEHQLSQFWCKHHVCKCSLCLVCGWKTFKQKKQMLRMFKVRPVVLEMVSHDYLSVKPTEVMSY